jgi:hypothetical protein
MRRREFVAGGAALAAAQLAFPARTLAQTTSTPRVDRIVDAHCHIFNAADLPIEGFARKIMVPRTVQSNELVARFAEYPGALEALVHAVAVQVKRGAPDSQAEIEMIEEFERDLQKKPTTEWRRDQDRTQLRSAFRLIWFNSEIFSSRELSLPEGFALEIAIEHVQLLLYQQLHEDFGKPDLTPEEREVLRNLSHFKSTPLQTGFIRVTICSAVTFIGRSCIRAIVTNWPRNSINFMAGQSRSRASF